MRTTKELLEILQEHISKIIDVRCLCGLIVFLRTRQVISRDEEKLLDDYVHSHRPFNFRWMIYDKYFWKRGEIEPRFKWLRKHIKLNS